MKCVLVASDRMDIRLDGKLIAVVTCISGGFTVDMREQTISGVPIAMLAVSGAEVPTFWAWLQMRYWLFRNRKVSARAVQQ